MKKAFSVCLAVLVFCSLGVLTAAAAQPSWNQSPRSQITLVKEARDADIEARLYKVLEEGIKNKKGFTYVQGVPSDDYIDLTEFGLSNEEGGEDRELLHRVFQKVFFDHPEFFYLSEGYWRKSSGSNLTGIVPMYYEPLKAENQMEKYETIFQAAVEDALKQVEGVTDPVEQLLILHDYLAQKNLYNWKIATDAESKEEWWARSAYGAMTGDCVCKGYALAYKLLMNRLGIRGDVAVNVARSHSWNIVQLNGEWYHIDLNWDNHPFPTLSGRCRHDYFLISDEKLFSFANEKYQGWKSLGSNGSGVAACGSTKYESGWAFKNQVDFPMYKKDGAFYYITRNSDRKFVLCRGGLTGAGETVAELPIYTHSNAIASGVIWLGDRLYYVNTSQDLVCFRLSDGTSTTIGNIPFTPTASQDGKCGSNKDGIGLRYNKETGEIVAASSTRRIDLARFSIFLP